MSIKCQDSAETARFGAQFTYQKKKNLHCYIFLKSGV